MATLTNISVDASPAWTPVPIVGNPPALLWNASDEAMTIRFGGAGDTYALAAGKGLAVPNNLTIEAQCTTGSKTLQVLVGGVRPVAPGGGLPTGTGGMFLLGSGTPNKIVSAESPDDAYISGRLEVDGNLYADGSIDVVGGILVSSGTSLFQGAVRFADGIAQLIGTNTAADGLLLWSTVQTPNALLLAPGTESNYLLICDRTDFTTDFGQAQRTDPTILLQSADATAPEEYAEASAFLLGMAGGKGARLERRAVSEEVTIGVGQGAAGVATSGNLAPADALILAVVYRVIDAPGGGAATLDIGRTSGGNLDEFIDGGACALEGDAGNTVADRAADTTQMPVANATADTLTLTTDANVTGDDMVVRVIVFYELLVEPTS